MKHNLPVEILGDPPPPKGDPVFELKPLPDTLKYDYLHEKKIYPVIISANLSKQEEERLLKTLKKHRASIAVPPNDPLEQYLLDHENDMFMNERREIDEYSLNRVLF